MSSERRRLQLIEVAIISALVTGLAVHAWDGWHASTPHGETSSGPAALRFSLSAMTGSLDGPDAGRAVVELSVVVSNDGTAPVTIRAIEVTGPGAGYVDSPPGGPLTDLPQTIAASGSGTVRFGMSSDCAVPVRPLPTVTFLVSVGGGAARPVIARIPDLDAIWGQTLLRPACAAT